MEFQHQFKKFFALFVMLKLHRGQRIVGMQYHLVQTMLAP